MSNTQVLTRYAITSSTDAKAFPIFNSQSPIPNLEVGSWKSEVGSCMKKAGTTA
jgi:hypothetical protein